MARYSFTRRARLHRRFSSYLASRHGVGQERTSPSSHLRDAHLANDWQLFEPLAPAELPGVATHAVAAAPVSVQPGAAPPVRPAADPELSPEEAPRTAPAPPLWDPATPRSDGAARAETTAASDQSAPPETAGFPKEAEQAPLPAGRSVESALPTPPEAARSEPRPAQSTGSQATDQIEERIARRPASQGLAAKIPRAAARAPEVARPAAARQEAPAPPGARADDRSGEPTVRPEAPAGELFEPQTHDRSPQAWAARLGQAFGPRAEAGPAGAQAARGPAGPTPRRGLEPAPPTPLGETARQFLRPRVGIDPAGVPIARGPHAQDLAAAHNAEALAVGDAIALGAGHSADTPETLGLIAHELVHVVRRRSPHFVPPLVRPAQGRSAALSEAASDEEAVASRVEAAVIQEARQHQSALAQPAAGAALPSGGGAAAQPGPPSPLTEYPAQGDQAVSSALSEQPPLLSDAWNGLPAPWEPLHLPAAQSPAYDVPTHTSSSVGHAPGAAPAPVMLAARDRDLPAVHAAPSAPAEAEAGEPDAAPAPDLDLLARQIYPILRRRLQAEQRRGG